MDPVAPPREIRLTEEQWEAMRVVVARAAPEEACGVLAGEQGRVRKVFPLENILHSPARFETDPADLLRVFHRLLEEGLELTAVYHSHPTGPPHPSTADRRESNYPNSAQLIWYPTAAGWDCSAFLIGGGGYSKINLVRENP